jgi:voltage-gated potassium channel
VPDGDRIGRGKLVKGQLTSGSLTVRRSAWIISLFSATLTSVAAVLVFVLDRHDYPNLGVALWWAVQTVTTVGYGDYVPQNTEGRIIGGLVMLLGVSLVAVVTASIAAAFVNAAKERVLEDAEEHPLASKLEEIVERLDRIEAAVGRSQRPEP